MPHLVAARAANHQNFFLLLFLSAPSLDAESVGRKYGRARGHFSLGSWRGKCLNAHQSQAGGLREDQVRITQRLIPLELEEGSFKRSSRVVGSADLSTRGRVNSLRRPRQTQTVCGIHAVLTKINVQHLVETFLGSSPNLLCSTAH